MFEVVLTIHHGNKYNTVQINITILIIVVFEFHRLPLIIFHSVISYRVFLFFFLICIIFNLYIYRLLHLSLVFSYLRTVISISIMK